MKTIHDMRNIHHTLYYSVAFGDDILRIQTLIVCAHLITNVEVQRSSFLKVTNGRQ